MIRPCKLSGGDFFGVRDDTRDDSLDEAEAPQRRIVKSEIVSMLGIV